LLGFQIIYSAFYVGILEIGAALMNWGRAPTTVRIRMGLAP
jgi:hypothetical protein